VVAAPAEDGGIILGDVDGWVAFGLHFGSGECEGDGNEGDADGEGVRGSEGLGEDC